MSGAIGGALAVHQPYSGIEPSVGGTRRAAAGIATAGTAPATGTPALVRYALGGGASVAVYRGAPAVTRATMETSPVPGVHVHFGTTSDSPEEAAEAPEATASSVTVHRGPTPAPTPAPPPAMASEAGSAAPTPAG